MADQRIIRGEAGGLPLVLDSDGAARCCTPDAIGQVALDWPPCTTNPTQAARVLACMEAARAAARVDANGLTGTDDAWMAVQAGSLLE
eukprot:15274483-Alexandrium_andersonii.AAC.1